MKPTTIFCACVLAVLMSAAPDCASAQSANGLHVSGTELLPQYLHPQGALFAFDLDNGRWRVGGGLVEVQHEPTLPVGDGSSIEVLGGQFLFNVGFHLFHGFVVGGQITATNNPNLFDVEIELLTSDGDCFEFTGVLDHTPLTRRLPRLPKISGVLAPCDD